MVLNINKKHGADIFWNFVSTENPQTEKIRNREPIVYTPARNPRPVHVGGGILPVRTR